MPRMMDALATCPNCSTVSEGAKFCPECGTPFVAAPPSERRERRVVSVLFADLVGFTSRSERLDVEDVEGFLEPYFGLAGVGREYGGDGVGDLQGGALGVRVGVTTGEVLVTHDARRRRRGWGIVNTAVAAGGGGACRPYAGRWPTYRSTELAVL